MADKIGTKFTIYLRNEALAYVEERAKEKGVTRSRYIEMKVVPKELQRKDNRRGRYERKAD